MKEERYVQLKEMISGEARPGGEICGVVDGRYEEQIQYASGTIQKESEEAKRLEEAGYVLIYPKISDYPKDGKGVNEYLNQNYAMIVDKVNENPNVNMIHQIAQFYNQQEMGYDNMALMEENASLTFKADDDLKKIYDSIGIKYEEKEHGDINVASNVKRREVEKGKMAQIYDKVKGKVKGAFNNLKSFFKGKENEKTLGEGQQEVDER